MSAEPGVDAPLPADLDAPPVGLADRVLLLEHVEADLRERLAGVDGR